MLQVVLCPPLLVACTLYPLAPLEESQVTVVMPLSQSVLVSTMVGMQGAKKEKRMKRERERERERKRIEGYRLS